MVAPGDVKATVGAFAALRPNGSVLCWGKAQFGGDKSEVKDQLQVGRLKHHHLMGGGGLFVGFWMDLLLLLWGGDLFV